MKAWTDYPIAAFGDVSGQLAPIRPCTVIAYDGDKYATVMVYGERVQFKAAYLYKTPGRSGQAAPLDLREAF